MAVISFFIVMISLFLVLEMMRSDDCAVERLTQNSDAHSAAAPQARLSFLDR
jgi:hypothetical protein